MTVHTLSVLADYHQFYVWDPGVGPQAPEQYTEDDVSRRVKLAENVVVVQPVRNTTVPVDFCYSSKDPGYVPSDWDHVVECGIELPTGQIEIHECTGGSVLALQAEFGPHCVRVLFGGLGTLSPDGLDGQDRYAVQVWPGTASDLRVRQQWLPSQPRS